jgi:hypothetical protein
MSVRIFDQLGRLVATLVNNQTHSPGRYEVVWNGRTDSGTPVASGEYLFTMESEAYRVTRKMVLAK